MSTVSDDSDLAWEVELDRLDLEILRVERLIKAMKPMEAEDWAAPPLSGAMPAHLLPRAVDIHERQAKALTQILRAMRGTERQRRFADKQATGDDLVPRYVDISA